MTGPCVMGCTLSLDTVGVRGRQGEPGVGGGGWREMEREGLEGGEVVPFVLPHCLIHLTSPAS